jgi:imidazolonepropionase-like amidohydrolase
LVVEGGTLLDPATGRVVEDAVVVIREGTVLASGSRDATREGRRAVGASAKVIDASGEWVLPGLVDAHVHLNALADAGFVLRGGATTARSGSSNFYQDVAMRPLVGWVPGAVPRIRAAGVFVTPQLGDTVLADPDLAPLAALRGGVVEPRDIAYLTGVNVSRGVDVVKTRANPRAGLPDQDPRELVYDEEQIRAVVRAAKGRPVLCHAYSAEGCHGAVAGGIRSLEHGVFVGERTIALMARKGTYFTPTMWAIESMAESSDPVLAERGREYTPILRAAVRAAFEAGVGVVAGTDTFGTDGVPVGEEAGRIHRAGIPSLDAIRACTSRAAELLGWSDRVGRLAPGYAGDLVTVAADPLDNPGVLAEPTTVVAQGVVVEREG